MREGEVTVPVMQLCHSSGEATMITDAHGNIEYVNPAFEALTGFTAVEAVGGTPSMLKSGVQGADFYRELWNTLRSGREFRGVLVNRRRDGSLYHEEKHIRPLFAADGQISHFLSSGHDVSEREATMSRLFHDAMHDRLTGLPNRALLEERLREALDQARRSAQPLTLMIVDLDHFKEINDGLGHVIGDEVLRTCAARLRDCARRADTVARIGGDEFVVLLPVAEDAGRVQAAIAQAFRSPVVLADGTPLVVEASVGAARYPDEARSGAALLEVADRSMYRDKAQRKARGETLQDRGAPGSSGAFELLAEHMPVRRTLVRAGQALYHAGDRFQDVFVLHAGLFKLTTVTDEGREELVSLLQTGDWIGFDGLVDGRHTCTATAADTGEVWRVRYEALLQAGAQRPELIAMLHREMARQNARERSDLISQHAMPADGRVADFLYRWVEGLESRGQRTDQVVLPVSRAELGSHLGLRIESVSRAMARLERERLIRFGPSNRRELSIPRLGALREFARRTAQ